MIIGGLIDVHKAGVLTISDKGHKGERKDVSGDIITRILHRLEVVVACYEVVPDEESIIANTLALWADKGDLDFIITTGGTGLSPRDVTPEATRTIIDKELPGMTELMRMHGYKKTPTAVLSRAVAGARGNCLIINLPGNPAAVEEYLELIVPIIPHAVDTLKGKITDHDNI